MSHISASEKPGPRGDAVDRADHRIGDAAEVDDRLVQDLGPAADVGRQVDSGSSTPPLNQFTSPPDEKARSPAPVTISAAQRRLVGEPARGDGELEDQLRAHRVERVGPVQGQGSDLAVDLDRERLELGRRGDWSRLLIAELPPRAGIGGGREP